MRTLLFLSAFFLAVLVRDAAAFIDPPYVTPDLPMADETVFANVRLGVCDVFVGWPQDPGRYPKVTREGNAITILWYGVRVSDPIFCNFGTGTARHPIGAFPPGDYMLTVQMLYQKRGTPTGWFTETLGVVPFTVHAAMAEPVPAPMLGTVGLILASLLLATLAALGLRHRQN